MTFLRDHAAADAAARAALTLRWLTFEPRGLFAELRREQPIFSTPAFVLVTRHADVFEVLGRGEVFLPDQARAHALLGAPDDPAREQAALRVCLRAGDVAAVAARAHAAASQAIAAARPGGAIDAVTQLGAPVVAAVAREWLGLQSIDPATLVAWVRAIDADLDDLAIDAAAPARAGAALAGLGAQIGAQLAGRVAGDDVLARLSAVQRATGLPERRARALALELLRSLVEPAIAAIALALAELLARPAAHALARAAAQTGDDAGLWALVREALRFSPPQATVARICGAPFHLAKGTANEVVVRPGARVLAAIASAAADPTWVDDPEAFRPGRPAHHDFLFAHGAHDRPGHPLVPAIVLAACRAAFAEDALRLTGPLRREGTRPASLPLALGAAVAAA